MRLHFLNLLKKKFGVELLIDQDDRKPAAMKPSGKGSSSLRGAAR